MAVSDEQEQVKVVYGTHPGPWSTNIEYLVPNSFFTTLTNYNFNLSVSFRHQPTAIGLLTLVLL